MSDVFSSPTLVEHVASCFDVFCDSIDRRSVGLGYAQWPTKINSEEKELIEGFFKDSKEKGDEIEWICAAFCCLQSQTSEFLPWYNYSQWHEHMLDIFVDEFRKRIKQY